MAMIKVRLGKRITNEVRKQASGSFVRLAQGFTHYELAGPEDGTVVLLVHGFSVPYYTWDRTFPALAGAGFRVIRFDLYGRGVSDRPYTRYDRRLFVEQVSELLNALHVQVPIDIVGTSMGGAVATAFAVENADRVRKIVLINPLTRRWKIGPLAVPGIGEYLFARFYLPALPEKQLDDFSCPEQFGDWPDRFLAQVRFQGSGRALLSTLRHFMSRDHLTDYQRLGGLKKKALLIWGDSDQVLGTEDAPILQGLLEAKLHWIKGSGHAPHYEHAEIVNPLIIRFLEQD